MVEPAVLYAGLGAALVGGIGFPIWVSKFLLQHMKPTLDSNTQAVQRLVDVIDRKF